MSFISDVEYLFLQIQILQEIISHSISPYTPCSIYAYRTPPNKKLILTLIITLLKALVKDKEEGAG